MTMTAEEILAAAADLVELGGRWGRGGGEKICLHFAICRFTESGDKCAKFLRAIAAEIGVRCDDDRWHQVWLWNDAPGRTAIEAATALRNSKRFLPSDEVTT